MSTVPQIYRMPNPFPPITHAFDQCGSRRLKEEEEEEEEEGRRGEMNLSPLFSPPLPPSSASLSLGEESECPPLALSPHSPSTLVSLTTLTHLRSPIHMRERRGRKGENKWIGFEENR